MIKICRSRLYINEFEIIYQIKVIDFF